jgi:polysaccharide export outer membrane protein
MSRRAGVDQVLQRISCFLALFLSVIVAAPAIAQNAGNPQEDGKDASAAQPYRINAGDQLAISVWGEERLQREVRVLPDGTFSFPLVGQIVAQGYLPSEIETLIKTGLRDQYRGEVPQVTVSVTAASGLQFSIVGRVNSPGAFAPGRYVNILEALSMAGGPTEFANLDNVLIVRKVGGKLQPIRLRLAPLFTRGATASDIDRANIVEINAGDTVIVP